jgi:hypothetical protein
VWVRALAGGRAGGGGGGGGGGEESTIGPWLVGVVPKGSGGGSESTEVKVELFFGGGWGFQEMESTQLCLQATLFLL